jgi:hypothetical protein
VAKALGKSLLVLGATLLGVCVVVFYSAEAYVNVWETPRDVIWGVIGFAIALAMSATPIVAWRLSRHRPGALLSAAGTTLVVAFTLMAVAAMLAV